LVYYCIFASTMSQLISKAERTKQFIVEKTAPVFNAKGFAGTSVNDLIQATGLSKGSIYGNFENKDEVALAAFDYNFGLVSSYLKSRMAPKADSIERLLVYPQTFRNYLALPFLQAGCPILNTATEADDTHPLLREKAANALREWKQAVEQQVERGISRQEIKPEIIPEDVAVLMISMTEGAIMQAKVLGNTSALKITMTYLEKFLRSLRL
jgi:TetR/AcrR family transcriptional repressor of nem operon